MTNFQRVSQWHAACGKIPGNPEHFSVAFGVDLEEWVEGMSCIELNLPEEAIDEVRLAMRRISDLATLLKRGSVHARIADGRRVDFLDALCDKDVTGNALAYLAGFDKDGADQAVLASNDAKLVDGKPVFVPGTQKIAKPEGWTAPNLTPFITQGA